MAELAGTWTLRCFNPAYVIGDQTPQGERGLIRAGYPDPLALTLNMGADPVSLEGTIEWQGGGLVLNGTVEGSRFDIVGTGRPRTETAGWEYHYHGYQTAVWPGAVDHHYTLLGSVIRITPHNGEPGRWLSPAGEVFSFMAVRQAPGVPWGVHGSWMYRGFYDNPTPVYYPTAPQTAHLISQEAVLKLEKTGTTLKGTIELPGGGVVLDIRPLGPPDQMVVGAEFTFRAVGGAGKALGWECFYTGHLTRDWPKPPGANRVDQRPALVGSVIIRGKPRGEAAPVGSVYPFIAVKQ
jgi:hypothetical protein